MARLYGAPTLVLGVRNEYHGDSMRSGTKMWCSISTVNLDSSFIQTAYLKIGKTSVRSRTKLKTLTVTRLGFGQPTICGMAHASLSDWTYRLTSICKHLRGIRDTEI